MIGSLSIVPSPENDELRLVGYRSTLYDSSSGVLTRLSRDDWLNLAISEEPMELMLLRVKARWCGVEVV
jgi:hypothetical protein